jgi:transcriptional regulator with XRE-family HTH domain
MGRPPKTVDDSTFLGRFAVRLRTLRERSGLTVDELAESISTHGYAINSRSVYYWESGRTTPPLEAIPFVAKALTVKVRTVLPEF